MYYRTLHVAMKLVKTVYTKAHVTSQAFQQGARRDAEIERRYIKWLEDDE